jgi:hypothetical protein
MAVGYLLSYECHSHLPETCSPLQNIATSPSCTGYISKIINKVVKFILLEIVCAGLLNPDTYLGLKEDLKKALRWEEDETADIVYVNATIWTGNPRQPWAEFMAVVHGQVSKIGNSSQIQVSNLQFEGLTLFLIYQPHG